MTAAAGARVTSPDGRCLTPSVTGGAGLSPTADQHKYTALLHDKCDSRKEKIKIKYKNKQDLVKTKQNRNRSLSLLFFFNKVVKIHIFVEDILIL